MKRIDLHVHTTASDGTCAPGEAVRLAKEKGLAAIAVTDHDTVSGYAEAAAAGAALGVEVVPGIELSARYLGTVHILGYYPILMPCTSLQDPFPLAKTPVLRHITL